MKDMLLHCFLNFKSAWIIRRVAQIRVVVLSPYPSLYSAFNEISHYKLFTIFFQTNGNFYQIILSHILDRGPNELLIKNQMLSEKRLLEFNDLLQG